MTDSNLQENRPAKGFFVNVSSLVSARLFLAVSQILVLPIIARYLTIDDFALMALVMSVVVFCSVLSDAGLGRSLIRQEDYDPDEWSSVFWLLVCVGIGLALTVVAISPLWARFFEQPRLVGLLVAMSVIPLCQAISAVPNAEIERRENYTGIARVQVFTTVISLGVAVVLALLGAGIWALVCQQLSLAIVRLAGIATLTGFRPTWTFRRSFIEPHLSFARDALFVSAITALRSQAAVVAIGKFLGEISLGLFAMSTRFSRMPQFGLVGPMSTVVYIRMSKAQRDTSRVVEIYLSAMRLMATILLPVLAMIAISGTAIFTVLLSAEWAPVAPIFALSIPGLALEAIAVVLLACVFRALGRTDLLVRLTTEGALLRTVLVVLAAWFFDVEAVAIAISVWGGLIVPRGWQLAGRIVPLKIGQCLAVLAVPALVSLVMMGTHVALRSHFSFGHVEEILLSGVILSVGLVVLVLLQHQSLRAAVSVFRR